MREVRRHHGQPTALLRVTAVARLLLAGSGIVAAVLGVLFWFGIAYTWLQLHILVGIGVTVTLITLVIIAWIADANRSLAAVGLVWALVLPVIGYTQTGLLPGSFHRVIEVIHLLLGVGAVGVGQVLAARIRQALAPG